MTDTIPAPAPQPIAQKNGRATASLVLGIVSLFINPLAIATILGIVFGVLGLRAAPALGGRSKAAIGIVLSIVGFFVGLIVFFAILSGVGSAAKTASSALESTPAESQAVVASAAPTPQETTASDAITPAAEETAAPESAPAAAQSKAAKPLPSEYLDALAQAKAYDQTAHLSKKGLLQQLTSDYGGKFPKAAAEYAVKHVGADWNANALAQAKAYEETAHLSKAALRDQLTSEYGGQFTTSQAAYALDHLDD